MRPGTIHLIQPVALVAAGYFFIQTKVPRNFSGLMFHMLPYSSISVEVQGVEPWSESLFEDESTTHS